MRAGNRLDGGDEDERGIEMTVFVAQVPQRRLAKGRHLRCVGRMSDMHCDRTGVGRAGEGTVWRFINIELHVKNKCERN